MGILGVLRGFFNQLQDEPERGPDPSRSDTVGPPGRSPKKPPFDIQCYIGSDIAQMQSEEMPPPSAVLVATVACGGNDVRTYLLETRKKNPRGETGWTLWQTGIDFDDASVSCRIAAAYPYSDQPDRFVAGQLLERALYDEAVFETLTSEISVWDEGVLSGQDVERIFARSAQQAGI